MYENSLYLMPLTSSALATALGKFVILKTKIKPVSINAVANCNKHILLSDDGMPTLFAQCS